MSGRLGDWLTAEGGRLTLHSGKVDIGQRISTALARIVAGELGLDPAAIGVAPVTTGKSPDEGVTSGSNSIEQSGKALGAAAATLRAALARLAGERLGTAPADLAMRDGLIMDSRSNKSLQIYDLLEDIDFDAPVDPDAARLSAAERQPQPSLPPRGIAAMVRGAYAYVHDLERPGMLHARVVRPPHALAALEEIDPEALNSLQSSGFRIVRDGSFLAIAGPQEYPTQRAARRLAAACRWDRGEGLPETDIFRLLRERPRISLPVVDGKPQQAPVAAPIEATHSATYLRPYQMHGSLAPSAALAEERDGRLTIHTHSQGIYILRASIAESLGLPEEAVDITHVPGSGCYGHNGADDAAFEAALVARALPGTPVLLKWTREEEHAWEPYTSAMAVDLAARLEDGRITHWSGEAFSDTHGGRPRSGPDRAGPRRLLANLHRAAPDPRFVPKPAMGSHAGIHRNLDPIYDFAHKRLVKNLVPNLTHRTSAMRCLGGAANVFAIESFMDELAGAAGMAPLAFRRAHLSEPRALAVLDGLEKAAPEADGYAYAQYKNVQARIGVAVNLTVTDAAQVRLTRAVIVADAGRVIDPDGLRAQMEGGFLQSASWALNEQVAWDRDGITSRDWDSYPVLRFDNVPEIEVVLLDLPEEKSLGAGEASGGPAVAAIANAVAKVTGLRLRRLPFTPEALRAAAMS